MVLTDNPRGNSQNAGTLDEASESFQRVLVNQIRQAVRQ